MSRVRDMLKTFFLFFFLGYFPFSSVNAFHRLIEKIADILFVANNEEKDDNLNASQYGVSCLIASFGEQYNYSRDEAKYHFLFYPKKWEGFYDWVNYYANRNNEFFPMLFKELDLMGRYDLLASLKAQEVTQCPQISRGSFLNENEMQMMSDLEFFSWHLHAGLSKKMPAFRDFMATAITGKSFNDYSAIHGYSWEDPGRRFARMVEWANSHPEESTTENILQTLNAIGRDDIVNMHHNRQPFRQDKAKEHDSMPPVENDLTSAVPLDDMNNLLIPAFERLGISTMNPNEL